MIIFIELKAHTQTKEKKMIYILCTFLLKARSGNPTFGNSKLSYDQLNNDGIKQLIRNQYSMLTLMDHIDDVFNLLEESTSFRYLLIDCRYYFVFCLFARHFDRNRAICRWILLIVCVSRKSKHLSV